MSLLLLSSCKQATQNNTSVSNVAIANKFVDAFYSFNSDSLATILSAAGESTSAMLSYQKWAECAHYGVVNRATCIEKSDSIVIVPVTVKDDLMGALHIDFNVTDTFHISIQNGEIKAIKTSSNDPPAFYEAIEWVKQNQSEFFKKNCEDGSTPCECVQGILKGFAEFVESKKTD
jgi:hypothetical protein